VPGGLSCTIDDDRQVYNFFLPSQVAFRIEKSRRASQPQPTPRQSAEDRAERAAAANPVGDDQQEHCCYCGNCAAIGYTATWCSDGTNRFCVNCWSTRGRSQWSADFEPAKWDQRPYTQCGAAGCALCKKRLGEHKRLGKRQQRRGWHHVKKKKKKSRTG
jgi:hypothetical protein